MQVALDPVDPAGQVTEAAEQRVVVLVGVEQERERQLLRVVHAGDALALRLRLGEGRQEHARQDGDDGDDHQQLDQGETGTVVAGTRPATPSALIECGT